MQDRRSLIGTSALSAALAIVAATAAHAQTPLGIHSCVMGATDVVFGAVTGQAPLAATGAVNLLCEGAGNNNSLRIDLSTGAGSYADRKMVNGLSRLHYNLYIDPAHTIIWGDGSGGSSSLTTTVPFNRTNGTVFLHFSVRGLVPAQNPPPAGQYADVIIATAIF